MAYPVWLGQRCLAISVLLVFCILGQHALNGGKQ